jgi:hypothetical protein
MSLPSDLGRWGASGEEEQSAESDRENGLRHKDGE